MKRLSNTFKKTLLALIFIFLLPISYAQTQTPLIENVTLTPNQSIEFSYSFGVFPVIFCYENTLQNIGLITWPFQGHPNISNLPIFLANSNPAQGSLADSNGTITITNNQVFNIIASCYLTY